MERSIGHLSEYAVDFEPSEISFETGLSTTISHAYIMSTKAFQLIPALDKTKLISDLKNEAAGGIEVTKSLILSHCGNVITLY